MEMSRDLQVAILHVAIVDCTTIATLNKRGRPAGLLTTSLPITLPFLSNSLQILEKKNGHVGARKLTREIRNSVAFEIP